MVAKEVDSKIITAEPALLRYLNTLKNSKKYRSARPSKKLLVYKVTLNLRRYIQSFGKDV